MTIVCLPTKITSAISVQDNLSYPPDTHNPALWEDAAAVFRFLSIQAYFLQNRSNSRPWLEVVNETRERLAELCQGKRFMRSQYLPIEWVEGAPVELGGEGLETVYKPLYYFVDMIETFCVRAENQLVSPPRYRRENVVSMWDAFDLEHTENTYRNTMQHAERLMDMMTADCYRQALFLVHGRLEKAEKRATISQRQLINEHDQRIIAETKAKERERELKVKEDLIQTLFQERQEHLEEREAQMLTRVAKVAAICKNHKVWEETFELRMANPGASEAELAQKAGISQQAMHKRLVNIESAWCKQYPQDLPLSLHKTLQK